MKKLWDWFRGMDDREESDLELLVFAILAVPVLWGLAVAISILGGTK